MASDKIYVLGAGLAGLSAAWHLQKSGIHCEVFEKESEVGGLCRSKRMNGYTFDYDGHLLHFRHRDTFELVKDFLKDNLARHKRNAWVYSYGRLTRYPFQANLFGLPSDIAQECLTGYVNANRKGEVKKNGNFLHWIKNTFGDGIARHFMIPYNTKFWTVPPQGMTCEWLEGFVPQPTLTQVIAGAREDSQQRMGYNAHFWYPRKGGIGQLPLAFKERLTNVHTGFEIKKINLKKRRLVFKNGAHKNFDFMISTLPLPELPAIIQDIPANITADFRKLRWNSIFNLNLGLRLKEPSDKHWIYFPQKESIFFRVGFYHNFSSSLTPRGAASLYAEVSYSQQRPINRKKIVERIEGHLKRAGIIVTGDEILQRDSNDIKYGYPIYDKNYSAVRARILAFLSENNIVSCGRYGGWRYMSMEDVILDGIKSAERLVNDGKNHV